MWNSITWRELILILSCPQTHFFKLSCCFYQFYQFHFYSISKSAHFINFPYYFYHSQSFCVLYTKRIWIPICRTSTRPIIRVFMTYFSVTTTMVTCATIIIAITSINIITANRTNISLSPCQSHYTCQRQINDGFFTIECKIHIYSSQGCYYYLLIFIFG